MATFTIDFWQVTLSNNRAFETLLEAAMSMKNEARCEAVDEGVIRLQEASLVGGLWQGEMLRIQTTSLPSKAKIGGTTDELGLQDDEGLGFGNAFLYHPPTRTLVHERNRFGVSAARLVRCLMALTTTPGTPALKPRLAGNALKIFDSMEEPTMVEIAFADIASSELLADRDNKMLNWSFDVQERYRAPRATITISMGHKREGLHKIKEDVRDLIHSKVDYSGYIQRCRVRGKLREADSETMVLDLLNDRIVEEGHVQVDDNNQAPFAPRLLELKKAWLRRGEEIQRMA